MNDEYHVNGLDIFLRQTFLCRLPQWAFHDICVKGSDFRRCQVVAHKHKYYAVLIYCSRSKSNLLHNQPSL